MTSQREALERELSECAEYLDDIEAGIIGSQSTTPSQWAERLRALTPQAGAEVVAEPMLFLSASERACYKWPGEDQQNLRAAYIKGASDYAHPPASALPGREEIAVVQLLLDMASAVYYTMDDSEDRGGDEIHITREHAVKLGSILDQLDELPDDQPGYIMGPAAKASWALRALLSRAPSDEAKESDGGVEGHAPRGSASVGATSGPPERRPRDVEAAGWQREAETGRSPEMARVREQASNCESQDSDRIAGPTVARSRAGVEPGPSDTNAPSDLEKQIDELFFGHARAVRLRDEKPLDGEPYMSIADAKIIVRRLMQNAPRDISSEPVSIEHDGFVGTVQGNYVTREGKHGVVLQQVGTRIVHVYGEKWLRAIVEKPTSPDLKINVPGNLSMFESFPSASLKITPNEDAVLLGSPELKIRQINRRFQRAYITTSDDRKMEPVSPLSIPRETVLRIIDAVTCYVMESNHFLSTETRDLIVDQVVDGRDPASFATGCVPK